MRRWVAAALLAAAAALAWSPPAAAQVPDDVRDQIKSLLVRVEPYEGPRVREEEIDEMPFKVLLPRGYERSRRRYPVLYLIHPGGGTMDSWLVESDLVEFSERRRTIVVLPDQRILAFLVDSRDGSCRGETQLMRGVIPYVDAHYRTLADRAHRAIAGASTGAFSATHLAGRHPDAFVAAGAFGGDPSVTVGGERPGPFFFLPIERAAVLDCGGDPAGPGLFGYPGYDDVWLHDANPPDLAPNYRGASLYVSAGDGTPCDERDVREIAQPSQGIPGFSVVEFYPGMASRDFVDALEREGIPHTADIDRCGLHSWRYWERDLHNFWPQMERAFGRRAPRTFDHRRAVPRFRVWGWRFRADPKRAPEFLEIRRASQRGLTRTGSGTETVRTARFFSPRRGVRISGAGADDGIKRPDRRGRLTFEVDLGPPHTVEQYRPENALAESDPDYFTTRRVALEPSR